MKKVETLSISLWLDFSFRCYYLTKFQWYVELVILIIVVVGDQTWRENAGVGQSYFFFYYASVDEVKADRLRSPYRAEVRQMMGFA